SGDARQAVVEGLGRTGRLVTSAAAILMLSFLSMSTGPQTDLKILATGLGAGILIDAVVVRCLLVPALVALFGRANWWLPSWLARRERVPGQFRPGGRAERRLLDDRHRYAEGAVPGVGEADRQQPAAAGAAPARRAGRDTRVPGGVRQLPARRGDRVLLLRPARVRF